MKICVINCSKEPKDELDRYTDLRDRSSCFDAKGKIIKKCQSFHSMAYSLQTEFFVYGFPQWERCFQYDGIIVLVERNIKSVLPLLIKLRTMKKKVCLMFHEGIQSFEWQCQDGLIEAASLKEALNYADASLTFYGQSKAFWEGFGKPCFTINHTLPFDRPRVNPEWSDRSDILIGTRTMRNFLSRNTLVSMMICSQFKDRSISWVCEDVMSQQTWDFVKSFGIEIIQGPMEYNSWLDVVSNHKICVSADTSYNLGQISLDALYCGTVPVGGTTWINQLIGTDDGGSANVLKATIERNLECGFNSQLVDRFHPGTVNNSIRSIFQGWNFDFG